MANCCILLLDCGSLTDIPNGRVNLTGTDYGSKATYACDDGYVIVGSNIRSCTGDGVWDGMAPTCERIGNVMDLFYDIIIE